MTNTPTQDNFKVGSIVYHIRQPYDESGNPDTGIITEIDTNLPNHNTTCKVKWQDTESPTIQWTNKLAHFTIQNLDKVPVISQLPAVEGQTLLDRLIADINDLVKQSGGQIDTQKLKKVIANNTTISDNKPNTQIIPTFDDRYVFGIACELNGKPVPPTWCKIPVVYFNKLDDQMQK